jgi:hypothetical protein
MNDYILEIPVLLIAFNRPDTTQLVFDAIREAEPSRLYIAADGPREEVAADRENCAAVQRIVKEIDWDCDVQTLFRDQNLGCKIGVSSAIDWFFKYENEGIILEDDCLPHQTFFRFCSELLQYYRDDSRVMQISGTNFFCKGANVNSSYYFSKYGSIWGWATWRRAWTHNDVTMNQWPEVRQSKAYQKFCDNRREDRFRCYIYDEVYDGKIDAWAYQWGFAKMLNSGLSIMPRVNLVSNIGFRPDATHISNSFQPAANMRRYAMVFPLRHPLHVCRDKDADDEQFMNFIYTPPWALLASRILGHLLPGPLHGKAKDIARKVLRYFH